MLPNERRGQPMAKPKHGLKRDSLALLADPFSLTLASCQAGQFKQHVSEKGKNI